MSSRQLRSVAMMLAALALPAGAALAQTGSDVANTPHNLTASGPGPIRVAGATDLCGFCHTPHSSNPIGPLWNRADTGAYYTVYASSTLEAQVPQPSGSSRLCLSCHDGTIALTQTYNPRTRPGGTIYITPADAGYIGTDLTDDHPISFVYDAGLAARKGQMRDPSGLPQVLRLDREGRLQCNTCHDPHDNSLGFFLRMDNRESRMCTSCHDVTNWTFSSHAASNASLGGNPQAKWGRLNYGSVRELACEGCHRPHSAGGRERLLRYEAEEDNCLDCHDGSIASTNIQAQLGLLSTHPVERTTRIHDPTEDPATMTEHVECADCHNAHQSAAGPAAQAPLLKPAMKGATGLGSGGQPTQAATYEYQVCYKCHAWRNPARAVVDRVVGENNIAEEFDPGNLSYHPVEAQGKDLSLPSLLPGHNATDRLYCTDCHGSDSGPAGPHGSQYRPLLKRNYTVTDRSGESPQAYALCYGCHDRTSILADASFSEHRKHVVEKSTPCAICHDPHGVAQSTALINFDRDVVKAADSGNGPTFTDLGLRRGSCTLKCHDENHENKQYP